MSATTTTTGNITAPTMFITTVPKFVAITATPLTKIRPAPAISPASSLYSVCSEGSSANDEAVPRGKKRRLDHLTWEEKVQRKKLKNRVAAQTSRDRKKARMEEMELEIKDLNDKTELLQNKCESLQAINDSLLAKNHKLDMQVEQMRQQLEDLEQQQKQFANASYQSANNNNNNNNSATKNSVVTCAGCESILTGSAVSNYTDPLQQGSPKDSQSTRDQLKKMSTLADLWKIVALCLLYKTCSYSTKSSMLESLKNLPKVCLPISQQTWREAIERAVKMLPKLQAEKCDSLDQWWGPQQSAWNPANIAQQKTAHKLTA